MQNQSTISPEQLQDYDSIEDPERSSLVYTIVEDSSRISIDRSATQDSQFLETRKIHQCSNPSLVMYEM